ncbi:MAG TPA: hypothetical protein VJY41_09240 [Prolixibacteraceae bacterium]|nr:hypothetical protein [Prolixibacteraceae bacterium]
MKKNLILTFLLIVSVVIVNAKTNQFAKKNEISVSFTDCPIVYGRSFEQNVILLNLHYNRMLVKYLSVGAYVGLGEFDDYLYKEYDNGTTTGLNKEHLKSVSFGSSFNLLVLPLFIESKINWIDLYFTAKAGAIYLPSSTGPVYPVEEDGFVVVPAKGAYFDSSIMGGIKLYPTRSIGFFAEYGYRYYEYFKGFHSSFGISVRF